MSQMAHEAHEAPQAVARLLHLERDRFVALGRALRDHPPVSVVTLARGSSDHAAQFLGYRLMARLGHVVASLPMSLITLQAPRLRCEGMLALALSQSGQSHDLLTSMTHISASGGRGLALVNDTASPLAIASGWVIPLHAGVESSVAATKSFICQLVAGVALVAAWEDDLALWDELQEWPLALERALQCSWTPAIEQLSDAKGLYVIGRGTGLAVAHEMALKFKEVCGLHAEAHSGAEVMHGPMALVEQGFRVLVLAPGGPAQAGLVETAKAMRARGARVLLAAPPGVGEVDLPLIEGGSETLAPIAAVQSFYPFVESLARARGRDPDHPPHLQKVTRTH